MTLPLFLQSSSGRRDFWTDLDEYDRSADGFETFQEVEDYAAGVREEISWKELGAAAPAPALPDQGGQADVALDNLPERPISVSVVEVDIQPDVDIPTGEENAFYPDTSVGPLPSFHASHILRTSTPRAIPMQASLTYPSIPTPSDNAPSLPPPPKTASPARVTRSFKSALDTPDYVPSPADTPTSGSVGPSRHALKLTDHLGEGRGRRDDPATPVPLGKATLTNLKSRKDLQAVTKHFELFAKSLSKGQSAGASASAGLGVRGKGKGRQGSVGSIVTLAGAQGLGAQGLGGKVFDGLRFCMPPEVNQVAKHKQRWEIISKLGGQVTLQPDTAITHVIYDTGRSASLLAQILGLQALSELPEGTLCVKWDWVVQCKMAGTLLDPSPWLSFPKTSFSKTVSANAVRPTTRMFDITDRLRAQSVSISRKREPTASESDTEESVKKRVRAADARSAILFPPTIPEAEPPIPASEPPVRQVTDNTVATTHEISDGTRWLKAGHGGRDALDEMIDGIKGGSIEDADEDPSEDDADSAARAIRVNTSGLLKGKGRLRPENFKCGQNHDGSTRRSPNEWLAQKFEALHDVYQGQVGKSAFAIRGYQRAAGIMRRIDYPITTGAQARAIPGIGASLADRIDEFLSGAQGRAFYEDTEQARCVALFKDIYGVGRALANKLYQLGARSISDLRVNPTVYGLTAGQKVGLDLYDDLQSRITREECRHIFELIQSEAEGLDKSLWVEIMGSYRRGEQTSGDVDVLITRDTSDGGSHKGVLKKLVQALKGRGVITHDLSLPHDWDALEAKWMGVGRIGPGAKYRRIDILCIPFDHWGAALIYFTGNEVFNRSLRLYARKLGYSLNQRGLYKGVIRSRDGLKTTEGEIIASRTEQEIFDVLGIRWRHPHHRRP